jgi:hypothetical protein
VIVLGVGKNVLALLEDIGRVAFPGRISNQMADGVSVPFSPKVPLSWLSNINALRAMMRLRY